jgi:hypothetical protein
LGLSGCLQLDTHVRLHEDGSGTITERLQFSKRLLEFRGKGGKPILAPLLQKSAVLKRMKQMGKGMRLVRHEVRDAERGAKEYVAVFKIPRLTDFRYVSPFLGTPDYPEHPVITCHERPMYRNTWDGKRAGWMAISFRCSSKRGGRVTYKTPTPAAAQPYRHLQPVFENMMRGLRLKFTFEGYGPVSVRRGPQRGRRARTHRADLIDFSADDLDRAGSKFLANEEVMLELLQMQINGPNVRRNVSGFSENLTVPAFFFYRAGPDIIFRPSRYYFDKHFKGKELDFGRHGKRTADPKKDIYKPSPSKKE